MTAHATARRGTAHPPPSPPAAPEGVSTSGTVGAPDAEAAAVPRGASASADGTGADFGASTSAPVVRRARGAGIRDLVELVRAPAVLTVLGDTVAGSAAAGLPLSGRRALLPAASACLYAGGMALNDWADRDLDAVERPERPVPSGRVSPRRALGVAAGLGAAGVALAGVAGGRRALAVALPLAACVWLYDARLKDTPAGPAAMAACRGLDVLLGAGVGHLRAAAPAALALAAHTAGVTVLSRGEVHGTSRTTATAAATTTVAAATLAVVAGNKPDVRDAASRGSGASARGTGTAPAGWTPPGAGDVADRAGSARAGSARAVAVASTAAAALAYLASALPGQVAAAREPDAGRARAATGAAIRAMVPLQAALAARAGRPGGAAALGGVALAGVLLRRAAGRRAVSET